MGPLNEWERRFLEVTQSHLYLQQANNSGLPPEYFGYGATIGSVASPLTNGATQQAVIAIQSDAWFLWEYLSVGVVGPVLASFTDLTMMTDGGNLLIQITDTGAGEDLFNIPSGFSGAPAALQAGSPLYGQAGVPFLFETPRLMPPNTNLNISVTKLGTNGGADNPDLLGAYIALLGARIPVGA